MPAEVQDFFITTALGLVLITLPWTVPILFKSLFGTVKGITSFFR